MKTRHFSIISMVIVFITMISDVKAQPLAGDKESARIFVQKFYDWYGTLGALSDKPVKGADPMTICLNHKPAYFEDKLRNGIIEDEKAQAKDPGEIVGLDFDPIANAQDTRTGFQTGNIRQQSDNFFVDVHDIKRGQSQKAVLAAPLVLTAEVAKINGQWMFLNFIYPKSDGGGNLLSILKGLADDRTKWAAEDNKKKHNK